MKYIESYRCFVTQEVFLLTSLCTVPKDKKQLLVEMQEVWPKIVTAGFTQLLKSIEKKGWQILQNRECIVISQDTCSLLKRLYEEAHSFKCKMSLGKKRTIKTVLGLSDEVSWKRSSRLHDASRPANRKSLSAT